jgi:hypothetical protein
MSQTFPGGVVTEGEKTYFYSPDGSRWRLYDI